MRGKCERGRGSANADGGSVNAGAEVQTRTGRVRKPSRAMGTRRGRLSAPWLRFHGADRADVYIIIHVRACCCGECALNPPTSPPIPRRRPPLAPAQRHALPEHFRSPTQPRRTPAGCAMHARSAQCIPRCPSQLIPRRRPSPTPAQQHALPEHFRSPTQRRRTPAGCTTHARSAQCIPRCPHNPFPAEDLRSPPQPRRTPAGCAMHSPPTSQPIPRRRPAPAPAQRHALPEHFLTPSPPRRTPAGCAMHSSPTSQHIPRRRSAPTPAQRRALPLPSCHIPAAQTHARRPHHPFLAEACHPSPHSDTPLPLRSTSGTKKRHRTVDVRCRMSRSTVVAVGHWGW